MTEKIKTVDEGEVDQHRVSAKTMVVFSPRAISVVGPEGQVVLVYFQEAEELEEVVDVVAGLVHQPAELVEPAAADLFAAVGFESETQKPAAEVAVLLEQCTNPYAVAFWVKQAQAAGGDLSLPNVGPYITSKLNQLTHNALLRPIVGQARSSVRLATCMGLGQIVLINLAKGHLGDFSARLLGMIVLSKLFNAALARSTVEPHKRRPFFVYLDEAHSLATSTTAQMLAEARKFGLHLTLSSQTLAHLEGRRDGKLREALLGNVGSLLLFRLGPPDARELAPYVEPRLKTRDLQDLPNFQAATRMLTHGRPTPPFVLRTAPPWPSAPASAAEGRRLAETRRHLYTRSVAEVEEELEAAMDAS